MFAQHFATFLEPNLVRRSSLHRLAAHRPVNRGKRRRELVDFDACLADHPVMTKELSEIRITKEKCQWIQRVLVPRPLLGPKRDDSKGRRTFEVDHGIANDLLAQGGQSWVWTSQALVLNNGAEHPERHISRRKAQIALKGN